ncbi:MAG: thiamine pyrophosphate-dependent enzyme, partial [Anaerolineae bacterium]|nr:thiamine pyrophosphate-dependent enzyme [Anaerolineae bacterium]
LPVTIVQFNNGCFGWIKINQQLHHGGRYFAVDFGRDTDHAAIARGFGLRGVRVEDPSEVEPVLREALAADVPTFVDVVSECETCEPPPVAKWQKLWGEKGGRTCPGLS